MWQCGCVRVWLHKAYTHVLTLPHPASGVGKLKPCPELWPMQLHLMRDVGQGNSSWRPRYGARECVASPHTPVLSQVHRLAVGPDQPTCAVTVPSNTCRAAPLMMPDQVLSLT